MTASVFESPKCYTNKASKRHIPITLIAKKKYDNWLEQQNESLKARISAQGFGPKSISALVEGAANGQPDCVYICVDTDLNIEDGARVAAAIRSGFADDFLEKTSFEIQANGFKGDALTRLFIGWGLAQYRFDTYKPAKTSTIRLVWHKDADKKRVQVYVSAVCLLRNLINLPANYLGPQEIADTAAHLAETHKAVLKTIKGAKLEKNFPLVHTVGKASPRPPVLIDLTWGKAKDPKLTLVGKGVVFDTGGLDIKPSQYMRLMKKDMGGAAHALALAQIVMALKLPVRLRVIIPAVENAVGGAAFRPGDIIKSRKGLTVENTNTDAEGRLILADALTLASEDSPDLIIDFATLTGSARAALGHDIPAMFSNNDKLAGDLQKTAMDQNDPLWAMPLWEAYHPLIESPIADLVNSAGVPGDLIYSALFLQKFLVDAPDWVHLDLYAWENNGRPGRSKGGTEMGLLALLALIEKRYG
ncbi:MAG: leucyl aminopeptidase family protein [Bdellovibrionales bacterium]